MTPVRAALRLDLANFQLALIALAISGAATAQVAVPPDLQGWEGWALHDHEAHRCPWLVTGSPADDERICAWPAGPAASSVRCEPRCALLRLRCLVVSALGAQ